MTKTVCNNLENQPIQVLSSIGEDMTPLEEVAFLAGRQSGKTSQIHRNLPHPKLDMKALGDFITGLQNSDKYRELNKEMGRHWEVCKEIELKKQ